jgi:hypothetical protein
MERKTMTPLESQSEENDVAQGPICPWCGKDRFETNSKLAQWVNGELESKGREGFREHISKLFEAAPCKQLEMVRQDFEAVLKNAHV